MTLPIARRSRLRCEVLEDRLTPSSAGDLDPTFNGTGINTTAIGPNVVLDAVAVAPDGKIVVAGHSVTTTGVNGRDISMNDGVFVARFLPNGQFDTSFHGTGRLDIDDPTAGSAAGTTVQQDGGVNGLVVQQDGSIVVDVASAFIIASSGRLSKLDRISSDGNTIKSGTFSPNGPEFIALNPTNDDVYVANTVFTGFHTGPTYVSVTRYDKELNLLGSVTVNASNGLDSVEPAGIALDPTGRVYVVASASTGHTFSLIRLDTDLSQPLVKTKFSDLGDLVADRGIAINSAGQIFVSQTVFDLRTMALTTDDTPHGMIVQRFDGNLDEQAQTALNFIGGHRYTQSSITTDPTGRVILVSNALPFQPANTDFEVARLNPSDLSLDASFDTTGSKTLDVGKGDAPSDAAVDRAGNIVVVGATAMENATSGTSVIFRLLGAGNTLSAPVLVGGSLDGSAAILTATGGSYQAGGLSVSFFPGFAGNVRTAVADVNGDGVPDYVGGSGPGGGPRVAVIDGKTGARLADFFAFESSFTGGVFVTAADLNGDGKADVVATPDQGGGPVVAVFDGAKLAAGQAADAAQLTRFLGIDNPAFRGGARPAVGDVSGDGTPDLLVSAGFLGGPRVALFDGKTIAASGAPVKLVPDFFAFEDGLRNGAFVTAGDLTGDGQADLLFGAGPGGAPRVRAFDAAKLLAAGSFGNLDAIASAAQVANFFAGDTASRGGVRLTVRDADGDGKADLITGSGEGEPASVRVYKGSTLLASAAPSADQTLDPFGGAALADGVFVG